ncbi:hypothetical protein, partial [Pseudorhizobium flavum]|uniref:hypothetical protein n=1 Tax=Pseudorhizobium flavum TaxID=1335061 RepID=UPI002490570F
MADLGTFDAAVAADADLTGYTDAAGVAAEADLRADALSDFNDAVASFQNAEALVDALEAFDDAVTAAQEAVEALGFEVYGTVSGAAAATVDADLFFYE